MIRLALRELEALAGARLTRLFAFLHAGIAGQASCLLEHFAQVGIRRDQRAGKPVTDRAGLAADAAALTEKDVKDSSTLDALNKELSVELPVYEGCVADDTAGFKSATDKLNEQTDWYKAHTTSLQKAVDAVNASKK